MSKFNEKELDAVLNQLEIEPSFIRLKELDGDINSNHFIVDDLEKDGYVKVDRMTNNDLNHISLTIDGASFKKLGGYSWLAKREQKQKWDGRLWNALCYILGIITTLIGQYVLHLLTLPK